MATKQGSHRVSTTLTDDEFEHLTYWADKKGMNINEYLREAILLSIQIYNHDFDIPDILVQRINALIDNMEVLSRNVGALENITVDGFKSLIDLTRGSNYLLEDEGDDVY